MQIVINMPESTYRRIQALVRNDYFEHDICGNSMRRIAEGKVLPKGHGRLIDGDKFLKDNEAYTGWILDSSDWGGKNAYEDTLEDLVNDADAIIEADRSVEE